MTTKRDRFGLGALVRAATDRLSEQAPDPPVVARLVIEIRSDGSRTVARGALEDVANGEKAMIEARGTTPAALAASLMKSLLSGPMLAKVVGRRFLGGR